MNAVVLISGNQYLVAPGDHITIPHLEKEIGETVTFEDVLVLFDEKDVKIGTPYVKNAKVEVVILSQKKGEKITVRRYKSKVRYRKTRGFRPLETDLEIKSVSA